MIDVRLILPLCALLFTACTAEQSERHADEAEQGAVPHVDAAADHGHGHGHGGGISITHFSDATELFVEYPPLVRGEEAAFAAHLTWLGTLFSAVDEGELVVSLEDATGTTASARSEVSDTPGIFRPVLVPTAVGRQRLVLALHARGTVHRHDLGEVEIHADEASAAAAQPSAAEDEEGAISFTKEQQWKLDFAHFPVTTREQRESVPANGVVLPAADGEATIASPARGLLDPAAQDFPRIGQTVAAGQVLLTVSPALATGVDIATLEADLRRARLELEHAERTAQRLRALVDQEAIPATRAIEAEHAVRVARAARDAAERRWGTARVQGGGIPLRSPLAGTVIDVKTSRGAAVDEGEALVRIADLSRVWLRADVPESDLGRIASPAGLFFELDGAAPTVLEVGRDARLVAFGGMVDARSRAVPAIFEIDNRERALRIGQRMQCHVFTGKVHQSLVVPASAVLDDGGLPVVFVMRDGESFERRPVRTGLRDGPWVAIDAGVVAGERVVSAGAYQVRLAATAPAAMGHGHAH